MALEELVIILLLGSQVLGRGVIKTSEDKSDYMPKSQVNSGKSQISYSRLCHALKFALN